jgi:serine/threonine-protein kinase
VTGRRFTLRVGDTVGGRFELTGEIGEGGMGRVYEAVDRKYDRAAAVKVIGRGLAEDEEFRLRFEREANAAERATHPHVLPVWDHGEQAGLLYLATPLCDSDVASLLAERGQLEPRRALDILMQIAWALDWAHGRGVVHRDVKPENILLVTGPREDHAYLADFGLAKAASLDTLTQAGIPAGFTPAYAAPEQWLGEAVGPAADQYALAATLYTCLAGRPPFYPRRGPSLRDAHLKDIPPELDGVVDGIPEALANAVGRGLAKSPGGRYGTCRELLTTAQSALEASSSQAPSQPRISGPQGRGMPAFTDETRVSNVTPVSPPKAEPEAAEPEPATAEPAGAEPEPDVTPPFEQATAIAAQAAGAATPASQEPPPASEPAAEAAVVTPRAAKPAREKGSKRGLLIGALIVGAIAVGAGAAVLLGGGSGGSGKHAPVAKKLELAVGERPTDLAGGAEGGGGIWVANFGETTVSRIRPTAGVVSPRAILMGFNPFGVAIGDGRVWVAGLTGDLAEIDPKTAKRVGATRNVDVDVYAIAAGFGSVWIVNGTANHITRISVGAGAPPRPRDVIDAGRGTRDVAVGESAVWVANHDAGTVQRLASDGTLDATIPVKGGIESIATGGGAVWVADPARGSVFRIDPQTNKVVTEIKVAAVSEDADVVVGQGRVYYVNHDTGTVTRIDPKTNKKIGQDVRLTQHAAAATIAGNALWVADKDRPIVIKLPF